MGFFSRFEGHMEDGLEGAADKMFDAPISPVQISKKAEKAMRREKMVGAGKQYAPTLYTVLVNPEDDQRLFGYYPTLAGETETYLSAKAADDGLLMDGQPLVRFIVDDSLKHGKFDVVAELVSAPIIGQLRDEEMNRYGLSTPKQQQRPRYNQQGYQPQRAAAPRQAPRQQQGYQPQQAPAQQQRYQQAPANVAPAPQPYQQERAVPSRMPQQNVEGAPVAVPQQPAVAMPSQAPSPNRFDARGANARNDSDLAGLYIDNYDPRLNDDEPKASAPHSAGTPNDFSQIPQVNAKTTVFAGSSIPNPAAAPMQQMVHARLVDAISNRSYDLASDRIVLGRSSTCDIALDDINASRSHAEIGQDPQGAWYIKDLGSTNGTLVNGNRISSQTLNEGDCISIGMTDLIFTLE